MIVHIGLAQGTGYKTILGIGDGLLALLVHHLGNPCLFPVADGKNLLSIGQLFHNLFQVFVVLQQLDGKETRGIFVADVLIDADDALHLLNATFQLGTVIDMDMTVEATRLFYLFFMAAEVMVGNILLMPAAKVTQYLAAHPALMVEEVAAFVNIDNHMEQLFNAFSATADRRQHRNSEQLAELYIVQRVSTGFQLIVHVQCNHHAHVHVNQLGGEIEIAFQVGRVHNIDNDIRRFIDNVPADIDFFRGVGREGIGSGKVDNTEVVTLEIKIPLLGIYRNATVIAHMLVRTGSDVEKRSFTTVGISHQSHIYGAAFAEGQLLQLIFAQMHVFAQPLVVIGLHSLLLSFLLTDNLYHLSLLPTKRNLISHCFVFDRVA